MMFPGLKRPRRAKGRGAKLLATEALEVRYVLATINGTVFNDANGDGVRDPGETGIAGSQVFIDSNYNGRLDKAASYFSTAPALGLTDGATSYSSIFVSGVGGTIADVKVALNIGHFNTSDLDVYLIGPNGRRVQLFTNVGGSGDHFLSTVLDDSASTSITQGAAPFTGAFKPTGKLSDFFAGVPNGNWTLEITDRKLGNVGTLMGWQLVLITDIEVMTLTDSQGNYGFSGLPAGAYQIGNVARSGETRSSPATVIAPVTSAASSVAIANFGFQSAQPPAPSTPPSAPAVVSNFQITVVFSDNSLTPAQQAIFTQAAARWSEIIVGDIPDAYVPGIGYVDDVQISASAPAIDGVGKVLGQAGPTWIRSGSYLPIAGIMEFDSADVASMQSNGTLYNVILHEMAHVLGYGTIWDLKGLVSGAGTTNPRYTGALATAEYRAIFGNSETSIPLENTGGAGTRDSHWRETVFRSELMTGFLSGALELSRVTIAQFADLGYTVNMNAATPYSRPYNSSAPTGTGTGGSGTSLLAGLQAGTDNTATNNTPTADSLASQTTVTVLMVVTITPQATAPTPVIAVPNTVVETPQSDNQDARLEAASEEFREEIVQSAIDSANFMKQSQANILLNGMSSADQAAPSSESALNDFLLTPAELDRFFALSAFTA